MIESRHPCPAWAKDWDLSWTIRWRKEELVVWCLTMHSMICKKHKCWTRNNKPKVYGSNNHTSSQTNVLYGLSTTKLTKTKHWDIYCGYCSDSFRKLPYPNATIKARPEGVGHHGTCQFHQEIARHLGGNMAIFCYIYSSLSTSQFNIESLGGNIYTTRIFLSKHAGDGWQQNIWRWDISLYQAGVLKYPAKTLG